MFDTTKEDLHDILKNINSGKLQLPDFQRDYVWEDDDVKSLIVSISKGFPVGALLSLETGGPVSFKPRLFEGVPKKDVKPVELLLDGQQRMTSLYQAMFHDCPVRTKSGRQTVVERHYYLDIKKAVSEDTDMEDAVVGVPADRVVRTNFGKDIVMDLRTREAEFERDLFPLHLAFDHSGWIYDWRDYWKSSGRDVYDLDRKFVFDGVINRIQRYKMPIIRLDKENSREAICLVFEKVNVGGKKLDAFELVTAIYAANGFDLREDWYGSSASTTAKSEKEPHKPGRMKAMLGEKHRRDVLGTIANTDFLQSCAVLHTIALRQAKEKEGAKGPDLPRVSCNRDALLGLPLSAYNQYADAVQAGFCEAARFMNDLKIISNEDIPYPPIRVALASIFAVLDKQEITAAVTAKLQRWFWCVTLGELYGSSTESRIARDVPELVAWLRGDNTQPRSLDEAIFQADRLRTLRSRLSAAYKAMHVLLMHKGCRDFITGKETQLMTFFDDKLDIHHIFPKAWCKQKEIKPHRFNSIVNKTPLSKLSNILISGAAPSEYLARIEAKHGLSIQQLDDILRTHLIEPSYLRADDFEGFCKHRTNALSQLIGDSMGKPVVMEHGSNEVEIDESTTDTSEDLEELIEEEGKE